MMTILYKSARYLVIDKPAGLPCHPLQPFNREEPSVLAILADEYPEVLDLYKNSENNTTQNEQDIALQRQGGLCHRIDNDTSGVLLLARDREAHDAARHLFSSGNTYKEYLAVVVGKMSHANTVDVPVGHHAKNEKKMVAIDARAQKLRLYRGKPQNAQTKFIPMQYGIDDAGQPVTLIKASIGNGDGGRRHQVRVHAAYMGFPLLGDALYRRQNSTPHTTQSHPQSHVQNDAPKDDADAGMQKKSGHFLHASLLDVPSIGRFVAPMPEMWRRWFD